jgi:hypothetical protein
MLDAGSVFGTLSAAPSSRLALEIPWIGEPASSEEKLPEAWLPLLDKDDAVSERWHPGS